MESISTDQAQQPRPEPQFIPKLKNWETVHILMQNGNVYAGKILKYNRYELLFQENSISHSPILIMKGGIESITPLKGNPFENKEDKKEG